MYAGERTPWQSNLRHRTELPPAKQSKLIPVALKSLPHQPSVSVLITCFNYGAYVGKAIDSALQQTYPPGEIIVSDDASQDNPEVENPI